MTGQFVRTLERRVGSGIPLRAISHLQHIFCMHDSQKKKFCMHALTSDRNVVQWHRYISLFVARFQIFHGTIYS
jgi:hypothetical protein